MEGLSGLFKVENNTYNEDEQSLSAVVMVNEDHDVFEGHFPQQAVLPGVCQIYLISHLLEQHFSKKLRLIQSSNIKFLNMIDPNKTDQLRVNIKIKEQESDQIKISATIHNAEITCLKYLAKYQIQ